MPVAGIASVVGGGLGLLGGLLGSKGGQQSSSSSTAPWSAQQPYMEAGMQDAQNIYNTRSANPLPTGPWVTPENSQEQNASTGIYNTGMAAPSNFNQWSSVGGTLAGGAPQYMSTASNLSANGIGQQNPEMSGLIKNYAMTGSMPGQTGADAHLNGAVTNAATGGLNSVGMGQSAAGSAAAAGMNPSAGTNFALGTGASYASNPTIDGQIDAANRDVSRGLQEGTLRDIRSAALTSGNANSSREGSMEAIATRGASDRMADNAAAIRSNAFNTGAGLGANLYASGMNTTLGAANSLNSNGSVAGSMASNTLGLEQNQGQFGTSSQLASANSANSNDLAWSNANANAMLGGNSQLGSGLTTGMNASTTGQAGTLTGLNAALSAGQFGQAQDQAQLSDKLNQWQANDTRQQSVLNDYWNIVGKPLGTQTTSTSSTQQPGSLMTGLTGAIGGAMSGYGLFSGSGNIFGNGMPAGSVGYTAPSSYTGNSGYHVGGT